MLTISCKGCGATAAAATTAGMGTTQLPGCRCCLLDHDHDAAASATGMSCRPVNVTAPPGFQHVALLSGDVPLSPDLTLPA